MLVVPERGLCALATPPAHCRGLRQPRQGLSRPSPPAPGSWQAGSLSPSVNSAGALASVTQGAEAQATEGSAGLEGVKPTGSAWAPAVARGWVADSQAPSTGGEAAPREIKGSCWLSHGQGLPRRRPGGGPGAGARSGRAALQTPVLVPSWGQQCTAGVWPGARASPQVRL